MKLSVIEECSGEIEFHLNGKRQNNVGKGTIKMVAPYNKMVNGKL
jgi:hypothetical protein